MAACEIRIHVVAIKQCMCTQCDSHAGAVGDEWDYVILSTVRSLRQNEIDPRPSTGWCWVKMGFICDPHQINVALTRARMGLIIIGM